MKSFTIAEGYTISYGVDGEHKFTELPEELCKEFCKCHDNGPRYSLDSRYQYSIKGHNKSKGISFGTARVVIQTLLLERNDFNMFQHKITITKNVTS